MIDLSVIGEEVRKRRTELGFTREHLATESGVSRARIEALENGRLVEMGFQNLVRVLNALRLDLRLTELNQRRPTLEDLRKENSRS